MYVSKVRATIGGFKNYAPFFAVNKLRFRRF